MRDVLKDLGGDADALRQRAREEGAAGLAQTTFVRFRLSLSVF